MSTDKLAAAKAALREVLLTGGDTLKHRSEVKRLQAIEDAKPRVDPSAEKAVAAAAEAARVAEIADDVRRLVEARRARIDSCIGRFSIKR